MGLKLLWGVNEALFCLKDEFFPICTGILHFFTIWKVLLGCVKNYTAVQKLSRRRRKMSNLSHLNRNTKAIAAIAIFAALYAALRIIPTVPMIGTGATFHLSDILAPLFGILLGPYVGGISIIIGTFAAIGLGTPAPFFGLDFLPAFVVAVSLGFLVRRKWLPVVILNAVLLVAYAVNPLTSNFINTPWGTVPYLWMHIAAFLVLVSPLGRKAGKWIGSAKTPMITAGFVILAFVGTMMQHLTGGILYEVVLGQITHTVPASAYSGIWNIVFYIYPWERLALIAGAVLVGVPVTRALSKYLFPTETKIISDGKTNPQAPEQTGYEIKNTIF
jgi:uncharacterized membrane protein